MRIGHDKIFGRVPPAQMRISDRENLKRLYRQCEYLAPLKRPCAPTYSHRTCNRCRFVAVGRLSCPVFGGSPRIHAGGALQRSGKASSLVVRFSAGRLPLSS